MNDVDSIDPIEALAIDELARRKTEEPLRYVRLNSATRRYAESWIDPAKRIVMFIAPNGVGKSWSTATLIGWTMWPDTAPKWFADGIRKKFHDQGWPKQIRIISTGEEVSESGTLQIAIKQLWPKKRYVALKARKAFNSYFTTDTGFTVDIMTYDQEAKEFEGATRGLIVFNEPPPEPIYAASIFRTRMGGFMAFPFTPLFDAAWLKDKLVDKALIDPSIAVIGAELEEACRDHSEGGHLPHVEIENMKSKVSPDEYDARVGGLFMHLSGVILKDFKRDKFMSRYALPKLAVGQTFQVVDPGGFNKPFAVIWGQVVASPMHGLQILREWPNGGLGEEQYFENLKSPQLKVEDYAKIFSEVEVSLGFARGDVHRIMDRRFGNVRDLTKGESLRDAFAKFGFDFVDSYSVPEKTPEISMGIQNIRNYLKVDQLTNLPFILLDPSCVNSARAMERWALDPKTGKPKDDVWKNFVDAIRYLASAGLEFFTREPDSVWNGEEGEPVMARWGGQVDE